MFNVVITIVLTVFTNFFFIKILKKLTKFTKSDVDDRIIDVIHTPAYLTVLLFGIRAVCAELDFTSQAYTIIFKSLLSLVSFLWTIALIRISRVLIENVFNRLFDYTGASKDVIPLISSITRIIILLACIIALLAIWEVDITPLLASAGIVSVIVAFAAKDVIGNFFSGVSIFLDKPYTIGDYVELDQKERGEVVDIGIRSTRIRTRDDILITIPNSIIANTKIVNESAPEKNFRIRIPIDVAYGTDIDLVESIFLDIASKNDNVIADPAPRVRFREFGENGLRFEFLCWAKEPALRGSTIDQLSRKIYKTFNEKGVVIPFPQRVLHIMK
jgi:small-conductance mechanosensitive channel